jgi:hypothetical protein
MADGALCTGAGGVPSPESRVIFAGQSPKIQSVLSLHFAVGLIPGGRPAVLRGAPKKKKMKRGYIWQMANKSGR